MSIATSDRPDRDIATELESLDRGFQIELSNQRALLYSKFLRSFSPPDTLANREILGDDGKSLDPPRWEGPGLAWADLHLDPGMTNFQILLCILLFGQDCSDDFQSNFRISNFPNCIISDVPFPFSSGLYYVDPGDDQDDLYHQSWDNFSSPDSLTLLSSKVQEFCSFACTRYLLVAQDFHFPDYD